MKDLQIIQWELCPKNGLSVSYSLNLKNNYFKVDNHRATTLLANIGMIQARRYLKGKLQVQIFEEWFYWDEFVMGVSLLEIEVYYLTKEYLDTQPVLATYQDVIYFMQEPCEN